MRFKHINSSVNRIGMVSFIFVYFFLVIQLEEYATATQCKNPFIGIEAQDGKGAKLSFILPPHTNVSKNWKIFAPSGFSSCRTSESSVSIEGEDIQSCVRKSLEYLDGGCDNFIVMLPEFKSINAGTWAIERSYETLNENGRSLGLTHEKDFIDVYLIRFDQRLHNKVIEVKEGEYIVMYFHGESSDNKACKLHHNKMNEIFDLNEDPYRFPKIGAAIQRIGPCGFRMQVKNSSEGEWTLTGEFGWTRQRAVFQILINSGIVRSDGRFRTGVNRLHHDFPNGMRITAEEALTYWELERPDGTLVQPSNMALMKLEDDSAYLRKTHVNLGSPTSDDKEVWKVRVAFRNETYLTEIEIQFSVREAPQPRYELRKSFDKEKNEQSYKVVITVETHQVARDCSFIARNGTIVESEMKLEPKNYYPFLSCAMEFQDFTQANAPNSWQVSFDYGHSIVNSMFHLERNEYKTYVDRSDHWWYSVRAKKYVKRGEELQIRCVTTEPLMKCVLKSGNGTEYVYGESSFFKGKQCETPAGMKIEGNCGCIATIAHATDAHAGNWTCDMTFVIGIKIQSIVQIQVMDSNLIPELELTNATAKLSCRTFPTLYYDTIGYCKWFHPKKGMISTGNSTKYIAMKEDNACSIQLDGPSANDFGEWTCIARLRYSEEVNTTITLSSIVTDKSEYQPSGGTDITTIDESPGFVNILTVICVIFIPIAIVTAGLLIYIRIFKKKSLKKETEEKQSISQMFLEITIMGPVNPNVLLHEQVEFLYYDEKRWEYPCKKLSIMKSLGSGNFGVVEKARAPNIIQNGEVTMVAVKKVLYPTTTDLRSLVMELKILANLGEHPNIVNFLGACTKDVPGDGLWMILEYCRFGDLKNYILKNKSGFIDKVDPIISGKIDLQKKTGKRFTERLVNLFRNRVNTKRTSKNVSNLEEGLDPAVTKPKLSITSYDSDNCPYEAENPRNLVESFSTGDLLTWSLQIAKGMRFLSERKVLHGDLASRNVLLTEKRVAKICDFGLARSIHKGYYRQVINDQRPVRISAIESLRDNKYSIESDVWAFGVLLWECFSLGGVPYEEVFDRMTQSTEDRHEKPSQVLLDSLLKGYRLDKPLYATEGLYDLMSHCWSEEPTQRPSFNDLVAGINAILSTNGE